MTSQPGGPLPWPVM